MLVTHFKLVPADIYYDIMCITQCDPAFTHWFETIRLETYCNGTLLDSKGLTCPCCGGNIVLMEGNELRVRQYDTVTVYLLMSQYERYFLHIDYHTRAVTLMGQIDKQVILILSI